MILPERSIPYKSFVKTALVLALRDVFKDHPDAQLRRTKVSIDYPNTVAQYPSVVIRFFEREITNAGVGHVEFLVLDPEDDGNPLAEVYPFRHYFYNGDIEFAVTALSSRDRDLISDAVVTALASADPRRPDDFFENIYSPVFDFNVDDAVDPTRYNFVNLNTDKIGGFGESQSAAPWLSEDQLQYLVSYRVGIFGEFYTLPPDIRTPVGRVTKVTLLPYIQQLEPVPEWNEGHPEYNPPDTSINIPAIPSTELDPATWTDWY